MPDDSLYAYAKACGIIGKSFTGKRTAHLGGLHTLGELSRLVFPSFQGEMNEKRSFPLYDLERRIEQNAVEKILSIINSYSQPPSILIRQLMAYEYTNLKACLHNIAKGDEIPRFYDIGRFRTIHFKAYPNLKVMLAGTEFEFIHPDRISLAGDDIIKIEIQLDIHYYVEFKKSLEELAGEDRDFAERILKDEISIRNCIWALRLRTFYGKTSGEISGYLDLLPEVKKSLEMQLDTRDDWRSWKWERFLNPEKQGENWSINPVYFQNAAFHYLNKIALHGFHRIPMSASSILCFIKIKQYEEDILTSLAEGLKMGMDSASVLTMLGVL